MGIFFDNIQEIKESPLELFLKANHFRKIISKNLDPLYISATIYKSLESYQNIVFIRLSNKATKKKIKKALLVLKNYQENPHKNIINITNFCLTSLDSSIFVKNNTIDVIAEYHFYTLLNNLEAVSRKGYYYEQDEIFFILISLVQAIDYLREYESCHNNIKLDTIAITEDGEVKIFPNHLLGKKALAYYQMQEYITNDYDYCYLTPGNLKKLINKGKFKKNWKYDVFSLGILGLELCTLKNAKCCFDFKNGEIDKEKLIMLLENIEQNFSPFLSNMIKKLLQTEDITDDLLKNWLIEIEELEKGGFIAICKNLSKKLEIAQSETKS